MPPHRFSVRIYYEDTDFSGAVYHASYLRFMERGRTEYLRALGIHQQAAHAGAGFGFVVRSMQIEFLRPARMDDMVDVETLVMELGGASAVMAQRVRRGDDVLVTARVKVAAVAGGRPVRLAKELREKLAQAL